MVNLKTLQEKARSRIEKISEEEQDSSSTGQGGKAKNRRRPSTLRIGIWIIEFIVFVFVLEHFLIRPYLLQDSVTSGSEPKQEEIETGELISQDSENMRELPGLTVQDKTYLPEIEELATGSEDAQDAQLAAAHKEKLPVETVNTLGIRLRLIPPGSFMMGSPADEKGRWEGEKQHRRTIEKPFYMGKFEITQEQWNTIMEDNPSGFTGDRLPVEEITWDDCQRFLKKLCRREDVPEGTYRLPTEAEWEYACRAGTQSAYYFGNAPEKLNDYAIYKNNSYGSPHEAGTKQPNAYGLYNMHGNVWEWCSSIFRPYPETKEYESVPDWRVIRGGNWYVEADSCRSANRARLGPSSHGNMLGFRIVREIETKNDNNRGEQ